MPCIVELELFAFYLVCLLLLYPPQQHIIIPIKTMNDQQSYMNSSLDSSLDSICMSFYQ